ncbi:MAG: hypothetical protein KIT84_38790 [Labilithrix sp.]|nr:hypothetical protein [Labilithrix sp.]MCW5817009.1 hypothetical protein [Labilithrix sp.]
MKVSLKQLGKTTAAAAALAVTTLTAPPAEAAPKVDWMKVLGEADHWVRTGSTKAAESPQLKLEPKRTSHALPADGDPSPQNMGNAWFGVAPKVTLVARDWTSSTRLIGDKMGFTENMRLAASTRMVVARVRLNNARFTPFMQLGFGQWRVDTRYVALDRMVEVAGQLGSGFEMRVTRRIQLAAEVSATTLIRYDIDNQLPQNVLWSAMVASRVQF